jgi:hypothetical protein
MNVSERMLVLAVSVVSGHPGIGMPGIHGDTSCCAGSEETNTNKILSNRNSLIDPSKEMKLGQAEKCVPALLVS